MRRIEGGFETADGLRLFEQSWLPDGPPKAAIVIVHGYAEHSGRYAHVAELLVASGYAVHAFDLRGHGRSEGRRTFVRSLGQHVADVEGFVARVRQREPGVPVFLLGHSMGGTVVASFLVSGAHDVRGAVLSGAALKLKGGAARLLQHLLLLLGRLAPRLPLGRLKSEEISRDPSVVAAYDSDPLVYRGRMPAGTAAAVIRAVRRIAARMGQITVPLLLVHGASDALAEPEGSRELYERAASRDKTLKLYEGLYHEVLNEPEKEQVLADVAGWLDAHTVAGGHRLPQGEAAQ